MISAPNFARPQSGRCVGGKVRVAGARDKNDNAAQFKMAHGAAEDERFGHVFHFDGGLHTDDDAACVEGAA